MRSSKELLSLRSRMIWEGSWLRQNKLSQLPVTARRLCQLSFAHRLSSLNILAFSKRRAALCDHVLDQVRPAIQGLGGLVHATKAEGDEIVLRYTGPEKLAYGIELMLRDKFPAVREIRFDG